MVRYIYDAWGNHAVVDANGNDIEDMSHIGNVNPFRYRGYYYDAETGLYYLQTRYYDPETGRFISQDSIDYARNNTVNGLNLYCYCLNNPIKYVDFSGCIPISNSVTTYSSTLTLFGFHHKYWGRFLITATKEDFRSEETGIFYNFTDINTGFNSVITNGVGINLYGWFGISASYNNEWNVNLGINITPYLHINASIGLDGISLGLGIVVDDTSYDLTVGLGLGPLLLIGLGLMAATGQAGSYISDFLKLLF